mgnify:CR=1 FL=1
MPTFGPGDLTGILPPMVTPFNKGDESISENALRQDIRYMIDVGKVHGIVVGGSTKLDEAEKKPEDVFSVDKVIKT